MADNQKELQELTNAYEKGIISRQTYEISIAALKPDTPRSTEIRDSRIGVVGDPEVENLNIYSGSDPSELIKRYLCGVASDTDHLPWGRMAREQAGPDRDKRLKLSQVYTALDTMEPERAGCEADVRECLQEMKPDRRVSALEMVNREACLVLLGDPGSGKTTLVNFLAHAMARTGLSGDETAAPFPADAGAWDHGALLPVRIILRDYGSWLPGCDTPEKGIEQWLQKQLADDGIGEAWPHILEILRDNEQKALILLDGLDEVPAAVRRAVKESVEAFADRYPDNRFIATCRIYAYANPEFRISGFRQVLLAPFSTEQIHGFIDTWYGALADQGAVGKSDVDGLTREFKAAVDRPDLLDLARNPLIMTVMALLHTSDGRLPDDRVDLYQWTTDLLFSRWKGQKQGEESLMESLGDPRPKKSELMAALYHAAFDIHTSQGRSRGPADIEEARLLKIIKPYLSDSWDKAEALAAYIRERTGLLICHKPGVYTFPHRTFQEYLAACHLTSRPDYPSYAAGLVRQDPDLWQIVYILAAGQAGKSLQLSNAVSSVKELCDRDLAAVPSPEKADHTRAVIAGQALAEIGIPAVSRTDRGVILNRVREWLAAALGADNFLSASERTKAGDFLAQVGDHRFDKTRWYLPKEENLGFIRIPAGSFMMGSDKTQDPEADKDEMPQHEVKLSEYWMARYPVTVAQYRSFLEDTGREPNEDWKRNNRVDNHPVVKVSWEDALAYCSWLTEKLNELPGLPNGLASWKEVHGLRVSMPTEAQWEYAARGNDGRIYPCGGDLDPEKANYRQTNIRGTSPIGCFSKDKTHHGVREMTGNVLEWCMDGAIEYTDESMENPIGPMEKDAYRVIRGGSWDFPAEGCRAACRIADPPGLRDYLLGFRLALPGQQG